MNEILYVQDFIRVGVFLASPIYSRIFSYKRCLITGAVTLELGFAVW